MPTLPPERARLAAVQPHQARSWAESFGSDPERYDRARPGYPEAMVAAIVRAAPGPDVLDIGCGTGIAARQFRAAGCRVLGVEVDPRMAEFAARDGLAVEVAAFEAWDPAGRAFDAVIAGQTWHWVDPVAGAAKAVEVLRPGAPLNVFWNVYRPTPEVAEAFSAAYRRVLTDWDPWARSQLDGYGGIVARAAGGIRAVGAFTDPDRSRFDWERAYSREEWLDLLPTGGDAGQLSPAKLEELLEAVGEAIDRLGGRFTLPYATLVLTAVRTDGS
jgi:SAM-dependent methyltransferase